MESPGTALVRAFFTSMQHDGPAAAAAKYGTPDLVWWTPGTGEIQTMLPGLEAVIRDNFDERGIALTIDGITDGGDRIAVEARSRGTLRNGAVYANTYHWLFVLAGDRIAVVKEYNDTAHLKAVLGPLLAA